MFDLTTIQLMNNHPVDVPFSNRGLKYSDNIAKSWESLCGGADLLQSDPIDLLDQESNFTPRPITDQEWEERHFYTCCHCYKRFRTAEHDPEDFWTCSQECRDKWVPF